MKRATAAGATTGNTGAAGPSLRMDEDDAAGVAAGAGGAAASGVRIAEGGSTHCGASSGGARPLSQGQRLLAAIPGYKAAQASQAAAAAAADEQAAEAAAGYLPRRAPDAPAKRAPRPARS